MTNLQRIQAAFSQIHPDAQFHESTGSCIAHHAIAWGHFKHGWDAAHEGLITCRHCGFRVKLDEPPQAASEELAALVEALGTLLTAVRVNKFPGIGLATDMADAALEKVGGK